MKNKKTEANVILGINALKIIMIIFTGPFLTAYFIKKSAESINDLSIYYIFCYIILAIGSFAVREVILNFGRITGYTLLLFAGLTGNEIVLNIVMVILTLSILVIGLNVRKISKFEE